MHPLNLYKCLAEDTRLKSLLLIRDKQELCVCDLQDALQLSQPKVSRHLAELRKCDLLLDERRGKWVYYRLNPSLPEWVFTVLDQKIAHNQEYLAVCQCRLSDACHSTCES